MGIPSLAEAMVVERASEVIDEVMDEASWRWSPSNLEVLAIATDGPYGLAIVDAHGDRAQLQTQGWRFAGERWSIRGRELVEGPGAESRTRWSGGSGGLFTEDMLASYRNYGFAPAYRTVELEFEDGRYRVPVLANGFWAFVTAAHAHADRATVRARR
jgi:hypothetical protein